MSKELFSELSTDLERLSTMITGCIKMLANVESDEMKLAFVLTLFDHVCETCGFDKTKVCNFYQKTSHMLGGMYSMFSKDEDK